MIDLLHPLRLMLSQNLPFTPIYTSWKTGQRRFVISDHSEGKRQIRQIAAHVLSNRQPPYAIRGGIFDILHDSGGDTLVANNAEIQQASCLFYKHEGIDIDPAAGVAFASLRRTAASGYIEKGATSY